MLARDVLLLSKDHPDMLRHSLADAAGVVSHSAGGQPLPVETRMQSVTPEVAEAMIEILAPIAAQRKTLVVGAEYHELRKQVA